MRRAGVILAAGRGLRMRDPERPKQFLDLSGRPVVHWSLAAFEDCPDIDEILVATVPEWMAEVAEIVEKGAFGKVAAVIAGGEARQESSYKCLVHLKQGGPPPDVVVFHDAVRPFVAPDDVSQTVHAALEHGAATLAVPVFDTIARARRGFFESEVDRTSLYTIQTPQGFRFGLILGAHEKALADGISEAGDDAGLVARLKEPVKIVPGHSRNIKITTRQDLEAARALAGLSSGRKTHP